MKNDSKNRAKNFYIAFQCIHLLKHFTFYITDNLKIKQTQIILHIIHFLTFIRELIHLISRPYLLPHPLPAPPFPLPP